MSNDTKEEGGKLIAGNLDSSVAPPQKVETEAEKIRKDKHMRKQAEAEFLDYMKRLRRSNEMKALQVEELRLGADYYHAKVAFRALQPEMEKLDAKEQAEAEEQRKKQQEAYQAQLKEKKDAEEAKKPKIVIPKMGKARDK